MLGGSDHELGVAAALVGPPDHLIAHRDTLYPLAELRHDAGEVTALARGEGRRPLFAQRAGPDLVLAGIYARGTNLDPHLAGAGLGCVDVPDLQDVDCAVIVKPHRARHS